MAFSKESFSDLGLFILRAGLGLQMALHHGLDKLRHFSERAGSFPDPLGMGHRNSLTLTVAAEFFCALLIVLGLGTRVASLVLSFSLGLFLYAAGPRIPWRKEELTLLYLAGALTVLLLGSGRFALDRVIWPKIFKRGGSSAPRAAARGAIPAR